MQIKLVRLSLFAYVAQALKDGVRRPCFAYALKSQRTIYVWRRVASAKRLAHEYLHVVEPKLAHEPWYAFDVFSYNPIRLNDKHKAVERSAEWRSSA